jgi:hypothetical protein
MLAATLAAVLATGCGMFGGEEGRIVRMLEAAAEDASVESEESPVVRMAGAARLGRYFTEDFAVGAEVSPGTIRGRDGVVAVAAQARAAVAGLRVRVTDVDVTLSSPDTATAYLTLTVSGREPAPGGVGAPSPQAPSGMLDARELLVTLRHVDGDWLIARVDPLSTLERP